MYTPKDTHTHTHMQCHFLNYMYCIKQTTSCLLIWCLNKHVVNIKNRPVGLDHSLGTSSCAQVGSKRRPGAEASRISAMVQIPDLNLLKSRRQKIRTWFFQYKMIFLKNPMDFVAFFATKTECWASGSKGSRDWGLRLWRCTAGLGAEETTGAFLWFGANQQQAGTILVDFGRKKWWGFSDRFFGPKKTWTVEFFPFFFWGKIEQNFQMAMIWWQRFLMRLPGDHF